jgi:hypothetical protein
MRVLLTIGILLGVAAGASAQESSLGTVVASPGCWPVTSRDRVVVTMDSGSSRTGTLMCMGPEEIMLTGSGTLPLSTIRQITKPRDSYIDGMLKGAAVGLVILAFCAPDCPGEYVMRATVGYAMLGAAFDGLQGNNKTIYRREQKQVAVGFTVRF